MKIGELALPDAAEEGKWFGYVDKWTGEEKEGVRIKVASADLDEYRAALTKPARDFAEKTINSGAQRKLLSEAAAEQAVIHAAAKYVLLDWEGITDDDGKALPCNQANRERLLKFRRFRESVLAFAHDISAFEERELGDLSSSQSSTSA